MRNGDKVVQMIPAAGYYAAQHDRSPWLFDSHT